MGIQHLTCIVVIVLMEQFYKKMLVKTFDLTFDQIFSGRKCMSILKTTVFYSKKYWRQNVLGLWRVKLLAEYELCQFSFHWVLYCLVQQLDVFKSGIL